MDLELFLRSEEFVPNIRHPNPWDLHQRNKALKTSGFGKQWGLHLWNLGGCRVLRYSFFEGLTCGFIHPGNQYKGRSAKAEMTRLYVKEISFLILKHLWKGQGPVRTFFGVQSLASATLPSSPPLLM